MSDPLNPTSQLPLDASAPTEDSPNAAVGLADAAGPSPLPRPIPVPPRPIVFLNGVSGRYRGTLASYELELRVDIDGARPSNLVSGDYYSVSGGVKTYFGSYKSGPVAVTWSSGSVTIQGNLSTTWSTPYTVFRITIPRTNIFTPRAAATIVYSTTAGATGGTYVCAFESIYFRTVRWEDDYEAGATLFGSYNTGTLPHGGTARVLDVVAAYAEAGVQMVNTAASDAVATAEAGADSIWTNAELETAMHHHFSIVQDNPQWQTYLLACKSKHELTTGSSTLFGIMFDYSGACQRQGCAVFQTQINSYYGGAGSNDANRHTLYCYVHELGHSFNLLHSWDKGRPSSLSWMNYDWKYDQINGAGSYWANFAFIFDDLELVHIRHDYRNSVIMGGDNWATNAGFGTGEERTGVTGPVVEDRSGLALELSAKPAFVLGEPVVVQLRLRLRDLNGRVVSAHLHPNFDLTKIAIKKPNGEVVVYEPLAEHLCNLNEVILSEANPSIAASAYLGYGRDGLYFDQPGSYLLKAAYHTPGGGIIASADVRVRVKAPLTAEEAAIGDLYLGDEQGRLFYLLGSDGPHLAKGNAALDTVLERYADHPLSVYAALVHGVNASRDFKIVGTDRKVTIRKHDAKRCADLIGKVFKAAGKGDWVDHATLSFAMRKAAESHLKSGDRIAAKKTLDSLKAYLDKQDLAKHELLRYHAQSDAVLNK